MKNCLIVIAICLFCVCELEAQCSTIRTRGCQSVIVKRGSTPTNVSVVQRKANSVRRTISRPARPAGRSLGKIRFGDPEIPRKEQLNLDIENAKLGTKKYVLLVQERERIALDEIHDAQRYIMENGRKNPEKHAKNMETIKDELAFIAPTLEYMTDFPFPNDIANIYPILVGVRTGKIKFWNLQGKSHMKILYKIQELQKRRLVEFQKEYLEKKF